MTTPRSRINNICAFDQAILIRDFDHTLWVQGLNYQSKLTSDGSTIDHRPVKTSVTLDPDEVYVETWNEADLFTILTSKKRLFIAEVLNLEPTADYDLTPNIVFRPTPFTNVDVVSYIGRTIIFEVRKSIFVFNHKLTRNEMPAHIDRDISLMPIMFNGLVMCHKLKFPDTYDQPETIYLVNYVHVVYGKSEIVETRRATYRKVTSKNIVFLPASNPESDLLDVIRFDHHPAYEHAKKRQGYYNNHSPLTGSLRSCSDEWLTRPLTDPRFLMMLGKVACAYDSKKKALVKINVRGEPKILNNNMRNHQCLVFIDGNTVYNTDRSIRMTIDPALPVTSMSVIVGSDFVVGRIKNTANTFTIAGETVCIPRDETKWCRPMRIGLLIFRARKLYLLSKTERVSSLLELIKHIQTPSGKQFYAYRVGHHLPIDSVLGSSDSMLTVQTNDGELLRFEFSVTNPMCCWMISLGPRTSPVMPCVVMYQAVGGLPTGPSITMQQGQSNLDLLLDTIPFLPHPIILRVTSEDASGDGVSRLFLESALREFESRYTIIHGNTVTFNSAAIAVEGAAREDLMNKFGLILHMSMVMLRAHIPIRLPLSILSHIKGRALTILELEYFVSVSNPEIIDTIKACRDDPIALENMGYKTYRECLESIIHFGLDEDMNDIALIAKAFLSYTSVPNLNCMNMPTLDIYVSGPYVINRSRFKGLLKCSSTLRKFMSGLIDQASELQLQNLLKNWSGTSVLSNQYYKITSTSDSSVNIAFEACFHTLRIYSSLLGDNEVFASIKELYDALTTPIDHLTDRPAGFEINDSDDEDYDDEISGHDDLDEE